MADTTSDSRRTLSLVGSRLHQFHVVSILGEGGMGDVYVGYDEKLNRRVALKVLRSEYRLKAQAKARLLREARILSQLDHPHICRIYDFLEGEEQDVLVLELIQGRSLSEAMRDGLDETTATRVAGQIADVLVAAHGKGIVHRDLKPGNVMLTPEGEVKVLDFGIARLLDDRPVLARDEGPFEDDRTTTDLPPIGVTTTDDSAVETEVGSILGTLAYMSPEQAKGETSTAASDMYSFGILTQEMFTGQPAYDPELTRPMLLVKVALAETRPIHGVDQDLGALVDRLKSVEPAARPAAVDTAERLAFIRDKPRRRRRRFLQVGFTALLGIVALVMALMTLRISQEVERANREATRANRVADFMVDVFQQSDPSVRPGQTVTAEELLRNGAVRVERELADEPLVQAVMMHTIGAVQLRLGNRDEAEPLLTKSLELLQQLLGPRDPEVAGNQINLSRLFREQERFGEAEVLYREAIEVLESQPEPDNALLFEATAGLGILYYITEAYSKAVPLLERATQRGSELWGGQDDRIADILNPLSYTYLALGQWQKADQAFVDCLAIRGVTRDPNDPTIAFTLQGQASLFRHQSRFAEAEASANRSLQIRETALGLDNPWVVWSLFELGDIYFEWGRYGDAEASYRRAISIESAGGGPRATALSGLARTLTALERHDEAEPLHREASALWQEAMGIGNSGESPLLIGVAEHHLATGALAEAERTFREQARRWREKVAPGHPEISRAHNGLGDVHLRRSDLDAAREAFQAAERAAALEPHPFPELARALCGQARVALAAEDVTRANELAAQAREHWSAIDGRGRVDAQQCVRAFPGLFG